MKKNPFLSLLAVGVLSMLGACSNEDIPDVPRPYNTPQITNPGLDRALRIAEEMIKELDGGATRSSRRIATIESVNQLTRSDAQAPNWFLVNTDGEYRYDDPTLNNKIRYTYYLFKALGRVYPN